MGVVSDVALKVRLSVETMGHIDWYGLSGALFPNQSKQVSRMMRRRAVPVHARAQQDMYRRSSLWELSFPTAGGAHVNIRNLVRLAIVCQTTAITATTY